LIFLDSKFQQEMKTYTNSEFAIGIGIGAGDWDNKSELSYTTIPNVSIGTNVNLFRISY